MAALFTSTSRRPVAATISSIAAVTEAGSVTSRPMPRVG